MDMTSSSHDLRKIRLLRADDFMGRVSFSGFKRLRTINFLTFFNKIFTFGIICSIITSSCWGLIFPHREERRAIKMDVNELMKSDDLTKNYDIQDINANKSMGILSYLWILVLVPIFTAKESKFAMFHAEQGITLAIAATIIMVLAIIFGLIPVVGFVFGIIFWLIDLAILVLAIIGIVNAANGQAKELPLIGKIKLIKLQ